MGFGLNVWKVLGASVEGSGHRRDNTGCQDAHAWTVVGPETLVAAVADGAGSAPRSAEGSRNAADFAVEYIAWRLSEEDVAEPSELVLDAMEATRRRLLRYARGETRPLRDFATTLAIVIATPDRVVAAQVGDGAVVVGNRDGALDGLANGEPQEYLNETTFLTSRQWRAACTVGEAATQVEALALLTDGLGLLALDLADGNRPHAPFFNPLLGSVREGGIGKEALERFLGSERVANRTDDDVTLVLAALA